MIWFDHTEIMKGERVPGLRAWYKRKGQRTTGQRNK